MCWSPSGQLADKTAQVSILRELTAKTQAPRNPPARTHHVCKDAGSGTPGSFKVSACQKVTLARAQLPRSALLRSSGRADKEGRIR